MNSIDSYFSVDFDLNEPLSEADYEHFTQLVKGPLLVDYLSFMKVFNGGAGPIGEEGYLTLFKLEELSSYNDDLPSIYSPHDYTVFASDGGNTIYAFTKAEKIIEFDLIGLDSEEAIELADSFTGFLKTFL